MDTSILKEKDQRVLKLIVEAYLEGGRPVSSGEVFGKKRFPGSPATIRNVMVRLEAKGYLSQPHTSAGRVPTDKGLRFYVNSLLAEALFPRDDTDPRPGGPGLQERGPRFPSPRGLQDPGGSFRQPGVRHLSPRLPDPVPPPPVHEDRRGQGHGHPGHAVPDGPDPDRGKPDAVHPGRARPGRPVRQPELPGQEPPVHPGFPLPGAPEVPAEIRGHRPEAVRRWSGPTSARRTRTAGSSSRGRRGSSTRRRSSAEGGSRPCSRASRRRPTWPGCCRTSSASTGSRSSSAPRSTARTSRTAPSSCPTTGRAARSSARWGSSVRRGSPTTRSSRSSTASPNG